MLALLVVTLISLQQQRAPTTQKSDAEVLKENLDRGDEERQKRIVTLSAEVVSSRSRKEELDKEIREAPNKRDVYDRDGYIKSLREQRKTLEGRMKACEAKIADLQAQAGSYLPTLLLTKNNDWPGVFRLSDEEPFSVTISKNPENGKVERVLGPNEVLIVCQRPPYQGVPQQGNIILQFRGIDTSALKPGDTFELQGLWKRTKPENLGPFEPVNLSVPIPNPKIAAKPAKSQRQ
ncbi:MAG TPA: hypothetical protein VGM03_14330 [Phycisphaerae bacterium]|jgi:hypothetical protein